MSSPKFIAGLRTLYKKIINVNPKQWRGSDVLNALDAVREMWGLSNNSNDQIKIKAMTQSRSAEELTTTLIEITGATQQYINKLKNLENT